MPEQLHFKLLQRMKTMICNQFRSNGKGLCNRCDLKSKDHRLTGAHSPRSGRRPGSGGGCAAAVPTAEGGAVQPRGSPASEAQQSDGPQRLPFLPALPSCAERSSTELCGFACYCGERRRRGGENNEMSKEK